MVQAEGRDLYLPGQSYRLDAADRWTEIQFRKTRFDVFIRFHALLKDHLPLDRQWLNPG
jgi:hypothetical protein